MGVVSVGSISQSLFYPLRLQGALTKPPAISHTCIDIESDVNRAGRFEDKTSVKEKKYFSVGESCCFRLFTNPGRHHYVVYALFL